MLFEPNPNEAEQHERSETLGELVVSRGQMALLLELADQPFHHVAPLVLFFVEVRGALRI